MAPQSEAASKENLILRTWTPLILRTVLITALVILSVGIGLSLSKAPRYYVRRFHLAQTKEAVHQREDWQKIAIGALHGDPHDVMTIGLAVLTLVPIARVAFTLILFVRERDLVFVTATAYVLFGLIAGILLGRIG
jgi:uncharacterized membrane protein